MGTRLELQTLLETTSGLSSVYFQPPPSVNMSYPCIVYSFGLLKTDHADNQPYSFKKRYTVTVIDQNPDSLIPMKIAELPSCSFDRQYRADNLNHSVFTLYF